MRIIGIFGEAGTAALITEDVHVHTERIAAFRAYEARLVEKAMTDANDVVGPLHGYRYLTVTTDIRYSVGIPPTLGITSVITTVWGFQFPLKISNV